MTSSSQTTLDQENRRGTAMQVARMFTKPGVHPFETVEWETRDAIIGFGGKISFEQRDVEFPKSWSQNSTNIVAQKYFRGQLARPRASAPSSR